MTPFVGQIVHYVSHGTPPRPNGTQAYTKRCRAAVVTELDGNWDGVGTPVSFVGLCVLNPSGMFFHTLADGGCEAAPLVRLPLGAVGLPAGGTWHEVH